MLVMAFGDPAVRIRMFLCDALAEAGRQDEAIAVADEMVRRAHLSGPADESDALATRGMMYAAFGEPRKAHDDGIEGRRIGRLAGADLLEFFAALNESWGNATAGAGAAAGAVEMARAAADGYRATGTRMHDPDRLRDARRGRGGRRAPGARGRGSAGRPRRPGADRQSFVARATRAHRGSRQVDHLITGLETIDARLPEGNRASRVGQVRPAHTSGRHPAWMADR